MISHDLAIKCKDTYLRVRVPTSDRREAIEISNAPLLKIGDSEDPVIGLMDRYKPCRFLPESRPVHDIPDGVVDGGAVAVLCHGIRGQDGGLSASGRCAEVSLQDLHGAVDNVVVDP